MTATGNLNVTALARARLVESMTFGAPGNTAPVRVQGFLALHGGMDATANANGESMASFGSSTLIVSSKGFNTVEKKVFSTSVTNDFRSVLEPILFSYTVTPGTPNAVDLTMQVNGNAGVGGPDSL